MAYTPKNLQIFTAAFAGALAGMGLSDRVISDINALSYAGLATVAGAWAQAVDTAWTLARGATLLDVEAVQSASAAYWQNRSPNADTSNTNPVTFATPALAVLAPITAGESYYASQGITPPAIPGGATGGGFPNAADTTTLSAIDWSAGAFANGYQYYIHTQRAYWILSKTGTETIDGTNAIAATPSGRWLRNKHFGHPGWLIVNTWYLDAVNGNDNNDGQASVAAPGNVGPLKTFNELANRWANGIIQPTTVVNNATICTVNILSDLPVTDPVYPACTLGSGSFLWYKGGVKTILFSGAFTAVAAASPSTNTALLLTDTTITWTTFLGRRWRITAGARLNSMGWVAKDLGANQCRSSASAAPANMNTTFAAFWPTVSGVTATTPQVGDTYNIEQLFTISVGPNTAKTIEGGANTSAEQRIVFGELTFRNNGFDGCQYGGLGDQSLEVYSCELPSMQYTIGLNNNFSNCHFTGWNIVTGGIAVVQAGLFDAITARIGIECYSGGFVGLKTAVMFQGCGMRGTNIQIDDACVFDSTAAASNPGGHGVFIGRGRTVFAGQFINGWCSIATRLWGNGNAGTGVYIDCESFAKYAAGNVANITITGTGGDFRLNNNTTANVWDQTALAGAGAFLVPRNCTWANLAASVATTGFGGYAQDVPSGARIAAAN